MGCSASSAAKAAVVNETPAATSSSSHRSLTGKAGNHNKKGSNSTHKLANNNDSNSSLHSGGNVNTVQMGNPLAKRYKREWGVRPGYSSGASSNFDDSEAGSDSGSVRLGSGSTRSLGGGGGAASVGDNRSDDGGGLIGNGSHHGGATTKNSKEYVSVIHRTGSHPDLLALGTLRQTIVDQGGLTEAVVRIATPFGKPIEEIYDGVHDGPVLGSGVSGLVRLICHRTTGLKYAVKILDLGMIDSTEGLKQLRDEIFIMCQLDHPNIVRIEEVYESTSEIYIVQELCVGGDLFDRLDEQTDYHYTEAACARLVKQMLSAVRYLHSRAIVHRDLKLENFLFSSREPDADLKMIDFGLSKHFELGEALDQKVGTPYTVAPEIIRGSYDEKCDLWALGVITYLLLCGETPFGGLDGENMNLVKQSILRAQVHFEPWEVWEQVSKEGMAFVRRLLQADPKKRPTAREAQLDPWIQVWAKKDAKEGAPLNERTVSALLAFKESSDMQKILSEVLSFTLLPEQIVDLRAEFEKIDTNGDGEISLQALKQVLMQNAEAGSLGALTEQEIEDVFDAIRIRKSEPTIRWHEFLAAGLSQAKIDDRNLRLAFDRLDTDRKGFISFDDLQDLMGNVKEYEALEEIWSDSLKECKTRLNRITFEDFKALMKGQPKEPSMRGVLSEPSLPLETVVEGEASEELKRNPFHSSPELDNMDNPNEKRLAYSKKRSQSHTVAASMWDSSGELERESVRMHPGVILATREDAIRDPKASSIGANRALYRRHREIRVSVLEASKQFDKMRAQRLTEGSKMSRVASTSTSAASPGIDSLSVRASGTFPSPDHRSASLIMRRGAQPPIELEDAHQRALFEAAARRCGRMRRERNKTKSDVTGMLLKAGVDAAAAGPAVDSSTTAR